MQSAIRQSHRPHSTISWQIDKCKFKDRMMQNHTDSTLALLIPNLSLKYKLILNISAFTPNTK